MAHRAAPTSNATSPIAAPSSDHAAVIAHGSLTVQPRVRACVRTAAATRPPSAAPWRTADRRADEAGRSVVVMRRPRQLRWHTRKQQPRPAADESCLSRTSSSRAAWADSLDAMCAARCRAASTSLQSADSVALGHAIGVVDPPTTLRLAQREPDHGPVGLLDLQPRRRRRAVDGAHGELGVSQICPPPPGPGLS